MGSPTIQSGGGAQVIRTQEGTESSVGWSGGGRWVRGPGKDEGKYVGPEPEGLRGHAWGEGGVGAGVQFTFALISWGSTERVSAGQ